MFVLLLTLQYFRFIVITNVTANVCDNVLLDLIDLSDLQVIKIRKGSVSDSKH